MPQPYLNSDPVYRNTVNYLAQAVNFFTDAEKKISEFFSSYFWKEVLFQAKLISLIICLIFAGLIVFLIYKINSRGKLQRLATQDKTATKTIDKKTVKKWQKIEKKLATGSEANYKLAVLEADAILEEILQVLGNAAGARITNFDQIQEAKKIKNKIIEDSGMKLPREEAGEIISIYAKALKDLGIV